MYNPLAKDQIGANAFAFVTGRTRYRQGAEFWDSVRTGIAWRYWYKNLTFSIFLVVITLFFGGGIGPVVQIPVNILVFGVTYVSLVDMSGYQHRLAYQVFAPLHRWVRNVPRFYLYLVMLIPLWAFMVQNLIVYTINERSVPPVDPVLIEQLEEIKRLREIQEGTYQP